MQNKAYLEMKRHLIKSAREKKHPLIVQFELTSRCNLDCKMCYVHTQNNAELYNKELSTEQWKQIFDEAYDCGMVYALVTGGECLLRKDFKDLYLHLWHKHIYVTVMSNGTLLSEDYVEFFKQYRPDMVQISLYGSNEDGYLSVTGHRGFEKALNAIMALKEANINIRVVTTPNKYMGDDYINILKLCYEKEIPIGTPDISLMNTRYDSTKDDYFLTEDEIFDLTKRRTELKRELIPVDATPEPCGPKTDEPNRGLTCNAGSCTALVTSEAIMHPCIAVMENGASIRELGFAGAWKQTVKTASEVVLPMECVGCAYEKTCPTCPAHRATDLRSGHCNPSVCEMTRRFVSAGIKKLKV